MPTKVLFGPEKLNELHTEQLPGKKALIVTTNGQSVKKYGYLNRLQKELELAGIGYAIFAGIRPNPTDINVMDAFFHASETVVNKNVHPMADMFALKTVEHVMGSFHDDLVHGYFHYINYCCYQIRVLSEMINRQAQKETVFGQPLFYRTFFLLQFLLL